MLRDGNLTNRNEPVFIQFKVEKIQNLDAFEMENGGW